MHISNDISANTVYKTLLHANLEDLANKIDKKSSDQELWVSIYNISLAVKQTEIINNDGPY